MAQSWHDLLSAHWKVDAAVVRTHIPAELEIDTFDGQAWLGVVPFRMSGVRWRCTPALPWISVFPELNVRTYVTTQGKPGVWFFSLDAANPIAVAGFSIKASARIQAQLALSWRHGIGAPANSSSLTEERWSTS
jgi:uncharacterized protein YqjF (DUF2071 family)